MNAPTTFQRFMEQCLRDYQDNFAIPYLDDFLIFSKTFEENLNLIKLVLQQLKKDGIKVKPSKCNFFKQEDSYLGGLFLQKSTLKTQGALKHLHRKLGRDQLTF